MYDIHTMSDEELRSLSTSIGAELQNRRKQKQEELQKEFKEFLKKARATGFNAIALYQDHLDIDSVDFDEVSQLI